MFILWILWTILVFIIGHKFGYIKAHVVVAKECERLGKFFVGETVYECVKITKNEGQVPPKDAMPVSSSDNAKENKE